MPAKGGNLTDRIDAWEHYLRSLALATGQPDNRNGVRTEFTRRGIRSRFGKRRVDTNDSWLDPIIAGGPRFLAGLGAAAALRALVRRDRWPPLYPIPVQNDFRFCSCRHRRGPAR